MTSNRRLSTAQLNEIIISVDDYYKLRERVSEIAFKMDSMSEGCSQRQQDSLKLQEFTLKYHGLHEVVAEIERRMNVLESNSTEGDHKLKSRIRDLEESDRLHGDSLDKIKGRIEKLIENSVKIHTISENKISTLEERARYHNRVIKIISAVGGAILMKVVNDLLGLV